jgi:hypothetical protein
MQRENQLKKTRSAGRIADHRLLPPRPTAWAALYALVWLGLPVLVVLLVADLLLYLAFTRLLSRCYGIACLFG